MNKWIILVLLLLAGGYWYKTTQGQAPAVVMPPAPPVQAAAAPAPSRTPTAEQCRQIGGRIIEGMGCVVGAPDTPANPNVPPEEMASVCQSLGQKYVREINACVSG